MFEKNKNPFVLSSEPERGGGKRIETRTLVPLP
jgi:hypothetical protein